MFNFLNSTILFAAAAALIPLIIHLFSRRRVKVVEFSSLRHLKQMQKRQLKRLKIRQWLLLLLRMLVILAVVLAFARPTSKQGEIGSHAAVSAVVLFDNSASMNRYVADGNLFEITRKRTMQLLETFSQSDEVCLIPLDRSDNNGRSSLTTAGAAIEKLERLSVGAGISDMTAGLEEAIELLGNAINLNQEIYIVTDRQRSSLPEENLLTESDIPLYIVELPLLEIENLGVVTLDFGGQLIQPGHDFDLVATVRNYGSQEATDRIASLYLNGRRVAQSDFSMPAAGETTVRFTRSVSRTGFHSGRVELSDDEFPGDNRHYFSFRIPEQSNLLIIDGDPSSQLLKLALAPPNSTRPLWSVKTATVDQLTGVDFNSYDVVLMVGTPQLREAYTDRLKAFVQREGSLLLTYGRDTDIDYFNQTWSEVSGVRYDSPVKQNFSRAGFYTLKTVDLDHPVFSVFDFPEGKPPEIKFYTIPRASVLGDARELVSFTGDHTALVESEWGDGKVLTFVGPMSPEYTDLASVGFFVPFASRLAEYLASDLSVLDLRLYAGEGITRGLSSIAQLTEPLELVSPDSTVPAIPQEDEQDVTAVRIRPLNEAGVYHLKYRGRELDRFAVNIKPSECDLASADLDQFALSLGSEEYRLLETNQDLQEVISGFRIGKELWQLFLWIAVVILVLEMLLGRAPATEE